MKIIETIGMKLKGQIDIFISLGSYSTKSNWGTEYRVASSGDSLPIYFVNQYSKTYINLSQILNTGTNENR